MIDPKLQAELRYRFNPDGSELRNIQLILLSTLKAFDDICSKAGVQYWLSSGNVLGAVRHGGFIPWDDDIDVEMLREDYLKLRRYFKENEDYALQDSSTEPYYPYQFGKFRDKAHHTREIQGLEEFYKYDGYFIDVFIMEDTYKPLSRFLAFGTYAQLWIGNWKKFLKLRKPLLKITRMVTLGLTAVIRTICKPLPGKKFGHTYGSPFYRNRRYKSEIFPLTKIRFEDNFFWGPHNPDSYLKRIYDNYMELPNLDNLHSHYM